MITHIIENGIVVNTILATIEEAQIAYPNAVCLDGTIGGIGWVWDGSNLTPPLITVAQKVPISVTMRQGRLALLQAGLLAQVQSAIDAQGDAEKIEWEYAQTIDRNSPLVAALAAALSLDDAALDSLFISAANL